MTRANEIKAQISGAYTEKLQTVPSCCEGEDGCGAVYQAEVLEGMPDGVVSFGCGNPVALASLCPGERVLDLGSGAGLDCFLAAKAVGPQGSVVGVDFTPAMVGKARENATKLGLSNVSFRQGDIEALPVDDASVDVLISNCVVNLAPDKDAVFSEAFRVLRHGGRLMLSDIVLTRPARRDEVEDMTLLTGCISGSLPAEEYASKIRAAGFEHVHLEMESPPDHERFWFSATISATKP